jgi:hypothetical protein
MFEHSYIDAFEVGPVQQGDQYHFRQLLTLTHFYDLIEELQELAILPVLANQLQEKSEILDLQLGNQLVILLD